MSNTFIHKLPADTLTIHLRDALRRTFSQGVLAV